MVKTPCSQCRGSDSIPGQGTISHVSQLRASVKQYVFCFFFLKKNCKKNSKDEDTIFSQTRSDYLWVILALFVHHVYHLQGKGMKKKIGYVQKHNLLNKFHTPKFMSICMYFYLASILQYHLGKSFIHCHIASILNIVFVSK